MSSHPAVGSWFALTAQQAVNIVHAVSIGHAENAGHAVSCQPAMNELHEGARLADDTEVQLWYPCCHSCEVCVGCWCMAAWAHKAAIRTLTVNHMGYSAHNAV